MLLDDKIFREYDIRGVYGVDFDADLAKALGFVLAKQIPQEFEKKVVVARDCRASSEVLFTALVEGLQLAGAKVIDCGIGPTPQLYFTVCSKNFAAGIQITASHNTAEYNGFKMMLNGRTLKSAEITLLRDKILELDLSSLERDNLKGEISLLNASQLYRDALVEKFKNRFSESSLKVVVDGANGVGGPAGLSLLQKLGVEVVPLYIEPDGSFPNHDPDPSKLENLEDLSELVVKEQADFGIAYDGDGDRIVLVDEKGEVVLGDMLLIIFGRELLKEVSQPIIIADVKCSDLLFEDLSSRGAEVVMSASGHSLVKSKMKELGAHLAGELSGHMFFAHDYYGFDDAMYASALISSILSKSDQTLSQHLEDLPKVYSTAEIRVPCDEVKKFIIAERAKELFSEFEVSLLDGVRINFPSGWGLVRASNTEPALVMRFEASSQEELEKYKALVESRIDTIAL